MPVVPVKEKSWLPYAGFALAIAGIIYQGGVLSARLEQTVERVQALEISDRAQVSALEEIRVRGAKNESKLDFLVEQAKEEGRRR